MADKSDRYLVERIQKGDRSAFGQLFDRYYALFVSFARKLLRDDQVAEDLVQNVFVRVWSSRERLDIDRNIRSYLLVAVRNEVFCYLRGICRELHEQLSDDARVTDTDAAQIMSAKDMERGIRQIIADMPERRREVFCMSRNEKLSNQEIADRLGLSVRTVEKHIENALTDIRHKFSN